MSLGASEERKTRRLESRRCRPGGLLHDRGAASARLLIRYLSPAAHVPRLGIFQECIDRRHMRDGKPFQAIQKTALKDIAAHECPGRIDYQVAQSDPGLPR